MSPLINWSGYTSSPRLLRKDSNLTTSAPRDTLAPTLDTRCRVAGQSRRAEHAWACRVPCSDSPPLGATYSVTTAVADVHGLQHVLMRSPYVPPPLRIGLESKNRQNGSAASLSSCVRSQRKSLGAKTQEGIFFFQHTSWKHKHLAVRWQDTYLGSKWSTLTQMASQMPDFQKDVL